MGSGINVDVSWIVESFHRRGTGRHAQVVYGVVGVGGQRPERQSLFGFVVCVHQPPPEPSEDPLVPIENSIRAKNALVRPYDLGVGGDVDAGRQQTDTLLL